MAFSSKVRQIATDGSPAQPCYELSWQDNSGGAVPCFCARDFGIGEAAIVEFTSNWKCNDVGGRSRAGFGALRDKNGKGIAVVIENNGGWTLSIGTADKWAQYGSMTSTVAIAAGLAANAWFRTHIKCTVNEDLSVTVVATVRTTADVDLGTLTATVNADRADFFGFYGTFDQLGGTSFAWFDNVHVIASGSTNYVAQNTATSYVYTFVNDLGEESPPSAPSATVLRPDGVSVSVTMPTTTPVAGDAATYVITGKRLYRSVSGATGTIFLLVAEVPLATATYVDVLDDSAIANNDVLESDEWDPPPDDLQGILALPNGIMAGFRRNQLCLSAAGRPHAWPVRFRYPTDTDIVAIANIDNTIVIGTKSFVYTATGNSPDTYSMSKPGDPQACVSKRSMLFLTDVGVVYASPDGLMVCNGSAGQIRNVTDAVFTKRQWAALVPASIVAAVHDGVYHFWYDTAGPTPEPCVLPSSILSVTRPGMASVLDSNTSLYRNDIVWNGSVFCAVSLSVPRASSVSADGTTWTYHAMPAHAGLWSAVAWNGTAFCAVVEVGGANTKAATSPDGITWTLRALPTSAAWREVVAHGSLFCAFAHAGGAITAIATSSDHGATWTARTVPANTIDTPRACSNGSRVCVVGLSADVMASSDGITWTVHAGVMGVRSRYVLTWNGTVFCTLAAPDLSGMQVSTSPDGSMWTNRQMVDFCGDLIDTGFGYATGMASTPGGTMLAVNIAGRYSSSIDNGLTWSVPTDQVLTDWPGYAGAMAYDGSKFVVIGQNQRCDHVAITP